MKRFYVFLKGKDDILQDVSSCFTSEVMQIVKEQDSWILTANEFELCQTVEEVYSKATKLLDNINTIIALYLQLHTLIEIDNIVWQNKEDRYKRRLTDTIRINVYDAKGILKLNESHLNNTVGSAILNLSSSNEKMQMLLSLPSEKPLNWVDIYNVIEFFGNIKGITKRKFATRMEVDRIRRTANYFRHLGNPKREPLDANPPSLPEARLFIIGLIQKWVDEELRLNRISLTS